MKTLYYTGRNPQNLSGVSWKIWKIKREGRVVETRWGPIKIVQRRVVPVGTLQRKRWPAFRSLAAAKGFSEARIREKLRRGYEVSTRRKAR